MTLSMDDLYGREMYATVTIANALPTDSLRSDGSMRWAILLTGRREEVWLSFMSRMVSSLNASTSDYIREGVEVFATTGDAEVTFEMID